MQKRMGLAEFPKLSNILYQFAGSGINNANNAQYINTYFENSYRGNWKWS